MLKFVTVVFALLACCYCLSENDLAGGGDARAKKKRSTFRLWALLLLIVVSKVAVFKIASIVLLTAFFQKLFYFGSLLLNYMMKSMTKSQPSTSYGAPTEYNTVGYSYGPPSNSGGSSDTETFQAAQFGLPSLTTLGGTFSNLLFSNKN